MVRKKPSSNVGKYTWTGKPYKKTHHRPRPPRTIMTRSQCSTSSTSFFSRVPAEVFDMILDKLSVREISVFAMVSKEITRHVADYVSTVAWKNKMILQSFHCATLLEQKSTIGHYRDLGLLFKRCTLLLPTKDRLKFIFNSIKREMKILRGVVLIILQTLIAGWDELECHRVFNFLCDLTNLLQKIEAVITAKPGWYQELQLRLFCRQVLLDPNQLECQFWLMQLLKPWPMVSQAHLLFILYGPLLPEGEIMGLPHSALWDLAKAILMTFGKLEYNAFKQKDRNDCNCWLFVSFLSPVIPQPWHMENVARLLVLCGSSLCYSVLASKALNGRLLELSRLIVYIVLVCEKDGYHMSWAVKLVQQICKVFSTAPERFYFIQQLENTFSEVTREFFEFSVAGNHFDDRETFQTLCILLDSSELCRLKVTKCRGAKEEMNVTNERA
uniref:F-box domain-containing protein n=1 Tax=Amphilophus citrinellus TaxID=61819 RepID=A0A3Q0QUP2_AMPCI